MRAYAYPHLFLILVLSLVLLHTSVSESASSSQTPIRLSANQILPKIAEWFKDTRIGQVLRKYRADRTHQLAPITKGTKVDGLSEIKVFLKRLGYLKKKLDRTDNFDDALELAIEEYQNTYGLNASGALDIETLRHMLYPRCGVADILNNKTTINTIDPNHWWKKGQTEFTYLFSPNNSMLNGIADNDTRAVIRDAFSRWSNVTMLNFTEYKYSVSDIMDIVVLFRELDGKGEVVGYAGENSSVPFGYFYVDKGEQWVLPGQNKTEEEIDLESVVIHQIGHLLGLEHSTVNDSIMYPSILPSSKSKLDFTNNDKERILKLFPGASFPPSAAPAPAQQGVSSPTTGSEGVRLSCWGVVTILSIGFAFMVLFY